MSKVFLVKPVPDTLEIDCLQMTRSTNIVNFFIALIVCTMYIYILKSLSQVFFVAFGDALKSRHNFMKKS